MHLNNVLPFPSHACKEPKCISTCTDQTSHVHVRTQKCRTHAKQARTLYASQHVMTNPIQWQREHNMYLNCVDQTPPMPARTDNASQLMLSISLPCQQLHKMYHNLIKHIYPMGYLLRHKIYIKLW